MSQLEDLLQECTVKLTIPGQLGWGTGFFVATGWILTCGHVVKNAGGQPVHVRWQQQENWAQAAVEKVLPDPYDLALLRVMLPQDANPPCVYLDGEVRSRDPLYLFGYPDQDFPNGCPVTFDCEGFTGDEPALIKFALGQVRPGMSGSPLLNQRTGRVCGMVKFTRDRSSDLGGGAISTCVILEQLPELRELQRQFHGGDRRWVNLITTQAGINFQRYLQAILANEDYREWQEVYTPTTVEDRRRMPAPETAIASQRRFSSRLKLRAETVKPDKQEQGDRRDGSPEPQERVEQWDVLAGLRNYAAEHVVLIGKPGSGKSTSLERLLWEEAEKALQDPNAQIPVLVKLRRCTGTIEGLIRDFLVGHQVALKIAQIEELLRQGRFLLLLDGLNELPEAFKTEVANFRDRNRRTTPMIVSTRDLGGGGTLGIEKTLKMLPLTEPQMREFVRGYLGEEGDRLFQQLQGDRLRKFAETPLLLWMLCRVFAHNGRVPDNLGLAFREFTQLHDQELQADAPADSKDQWPKLLRHLAFVMIQGKTLIDPQLSMLKEEAEDCLTAYLQQAGRSNPREDAERWLKDLLKYHLIQPVIQPNFEEHIEFRHQLIQEYYAAEQLLRLLPDLTDDQLKQDYLNYLKWAEPVALMLALVDDEAQMQWVVKLALDDVDLMLGARLAGAVKPKVQTVTTQWIDELKMPIDLKLQCLKTSNSDEAVLKLHKIFDNANSALRLKVIRTLGDLGKESAISSLLSVLKDPDSDMEIRWEAIGALGAIGGEVVATELLKLFENSSANDKLQIRMALSRLSREGNINIDIFIQVSQNYKEEYVRKIAIEALGNSGRDSAIPVLHKLFQNKESTIRRSAVQALESFGGKTAVNNLLKALKDPESSIREYAAIALREADDQAVIPSLVATLDDSDPNVHWAAITSLYDLGYKSVTLLILNRLENPDLDIRKTAVAMLETMDDGVALPALLTALKDKNEEVRMNAAHSLGSINCEAAVIALTEAIKDSSTMVQWTSVQALGKQRNDSSVSSLLTALNHPDHTIRLLAVNGLVGIDSRASMLALIEAVKHSDVNVRRYAVQGLGLHREYIHPSIKLESVVSTLREACKDLDNYVQMLAVIALGKIMHQQNISDGVDVSLSEEIIPGLIKVINHPSIDPNHELRWDAANTLGKLGSPMLLDHLQKMHYQKPNDYLWEVIRSIQNRCQFYNHEIWQAHRAAQKCDRHTQPNRDPNAITIHTLESLTIMANKAPIFNQQHATIGVNYAAEGSNIKFTQHTSSSEQTFELLLTDYQQFIQQLQQKYPTVADATTVPQIIEVEAKLIEAQDHPRWQNFLNLKRLWNGSKKAGVKVGEHFAENNVWAKGAIAFLEGISEDGK